MSSVEERLAEVRRSLEAETEARKKEDATLLAAIETLAKTVNQETIDHMTSIREVRDMFNQSFTQAKEGISNLSVEFDKQRAGTEEFLQTLNAMKRIFDLEQCEQVNKQKEAANWIQEARASVESVQEECRKQQKQNDDMMKVFAALKTVVDKEAIERLNGDVKLDKHILETDDMRNSLMKHLNTNINEVRKEFNSQKGSCEELLRVINALKHTFDREQHENVMKHNDLLKCIEDSGNNHEALDRLRKLRSQTNANLGITDPRKSPTQSVVPVQSLQQSVKVAAPAAVGQPTLTAQAASPSAPPSARPAVPQEAITHEVTQATKKFMDAVEQERKDRTASYGLLHSHMANFQYDFAVERNERTQLHGDLIALKAELIPQIKNLRQGLDSVTQDLRTELHSIKDTSPDSKEVTFRERAPDMHAFDMNTIQETIRDQVVQIFSEHQARHKELTETIQVMSGQEKAARMSDIARLHELVKELRSRVDSQATQSAIEYRPKDVAALDTVTRAEFDSHSRRIWEAIVPDGSAIPRDEFEDNLQRIWEAIMQLQAKQLEDMKRETRETAFNNGLMVDMGSHASSPQKQLSNSIRAIAPSSIASSGSVSPSMLIRTSGGSPFRSSMGRSNLTSSQQSPSPAGSGASLVSAPTALMNDSLLPSVAGDAITPRTGVGRRTPVVPHVMHRQ